MTLRTGTSGGRRGAPAVVTLQAATAPETAPAFLQATCFRACASVPADVAPVA